MENKTNQAILIGGLDDFDFPEKLKKFVFNVNRMKNGEFITKEENVP